MTKVVVICITFLVLTSCNNSPIRSEYNPLKKWIMENSYFIEDIDQAIPPKDLHPVRKIVGQAELVCLGESRHDISEQFVFKHRIMQYLIEEMDFKAFALEASLPYSNQINDFVLHGNGNLYDLLSGMPGWFLWDNQEMAAILSWIRDYNSEQVDQQKVRFYGIDIVAPGNGLDQIFHYMEEHDPVFFDSIRKMDFARELIEDNYWPRTMQRYAELSPERQDLLAENYKILLGQIEKEEARYIAQSSASEYDWISRLISCAIEANHMFSTEDRMEVGLIRDAAMAQNTMWVKELPGSERVIVWAHNVHISRGEFTMSGYDGSIKGMGYILGEKLKDKMCSIGASFNRGTFQQENRVFEPADAASIDGTMAQLGKQYAIVDLGGKLNDTDVSQWLQTENTMIGQDFMISCVPSESFDAIFFTDSISKVNYNQTTLERFNN